MDIPRLHESLTTAWWKRQAKTLAGAKPAVLDQRLTALERAHGLLDFGRFDSQRLGKAEDVEDRVAKLEGDFARTVKAVIEFAKAVEASAERWQTQFKSDAKAKEGLSAVARTLREVAAYRDKLEDFVEEARAALGERLDQLQEKEAPPPDDGKKADTPERRRVRTRMIDQLRIVKHRPDRKVYFLLCVGNDSAVAWLHASPVSDSQKPLLTKVLQGDRGFKWYRGECRWESGAVTFIGPNLSSSLARRIQTGADELAGGSVGYRMRAHD